MHVVSRKKPREFSARHPDADASLAIWFKLMKRSRFSNLADLKQTFGANVDYVPKEKGNFHVFDIAGNKYRLIAILRFNTRESVHP